MKSAVITHAAKSSSTSLHRRRLHTLAMNRLNGECIAVYVIPARGCRFFLYFAITPCANCTNSANLMCRYGRYSACFIIGGMKLAIGTSTPSSASLLWDYIIFYALARLYIRYGRREVCTYNVSLLTFERSRGRGSINVIGEYISYVLYNT